MNAMSVFVSWVRRLLRSRLVWVWGEYPAKTHKQDYQRGLRQRAQPSLSDNPPQVMCFASPVEEGGEARDKRKEIRPEAPRLSADEQAAQISAYYGCEPTIGPDGARHWVRQTNQASQR